MVDVEALGVDLLTLAGHKFYAPKGIGALYVREGTPIAASCSGPGTSVACVREPRTCPTSPALGAAAGWRAAVARGHSLRQRLDALHRRLAAGIPGLTLNGHPKERLPNTLNLSFPGVTGRTCSRQRRRRRLRRLGLSFASTTQSAACSRRWAGTPLARAAPCGYR